MNDIWTAFLATVLLTFVGTWYLHLLFKHVSFWTGKIDRIEYRLVDLFIKAPGSRVAASVMVGIAAALLVGP